MLPYFYQENTCKPGDTITLDKNNAHHIVSVLRMKVQSELIIVNGKGTKSKCVLLNTDKHRCTLSVLETEFIPQRDTRLIIAIGLTRNRIRNEWFFEKCTEIGTDIIIPLNCSNSERDKLNVDRAAQVMASAMIQSQQAYMPTITEVQTPEMVSATYSNKENWQILVAHCKEDNKYSVINKLEKSKNTLLFIGPEGDFTDKEIETLLGNNAHPISLGPNRLRTETAGIYVCSIFNQLNYGL